MKSHFLREQQCLLSDVIQIFLYGSHRLAASSFLQDIATSFDIQENANDSHVHN